jgi:hypothetical protein
MARVSVDVPRGTSWIRQVVSAAILVGARSPEDVLAGAQIDALRAVQRAMLGTAPGWVADVAWHAVGGLGELQHEDWVPGSALPIWADRVTVTVTARAKPAPPSELTDPALAREFLDARTGPC